MITIEELESRFEHDRDVEGNLVRIGHYQEVVSRYMPKYVDLEWDIFSPIMFRIWTNPYHQPKILVIESIV